MICKFLSDTLLHNRRNSTLQWSPSDTAERYSTTNGIHNNYFPTDISYVYNSDGFRSDELAKEADLEILFMGCSFTEGIGLPLTEIWSTLLLNKIRNLPQFSGKHIPYKSIAVGGSGIDNQSRLLHGYIDKVKPKYIFYGHPHLYRREYNFDNIHGRNWVPHIDSLRNNQRMEEIFVDNNHASATTYRGFLLLDALSQKYNTKVFILHRNNNPDTATLIKIIDQVGGNLHNVLLPDEKLATPFFNPVAYDRARRAPIHARDNTHPGALWHYNTASWGWDLIISEFVS